jgi:hypothetical protein
VKQQSPLPGGGPSPFTLDLRSAGWHPDATEDVKGDRRELFIEEAIGLDSSGLIPFPVPKSKDASGNDVPFKEPATSAEFAQFNRWILGGSIPDALTGEAPLTSLLRDLAGWCRRYNASLYRLRRLHFVAYNPDQTAPIPPKNPHGDPDLPPTGGVTLAQLIADAEANWRDIVVPGMNQLLDEPQTYGSHTIEVIAADMVEVNGYIVSMRITVRDVVAGGQIGGSSSHVSISSAFSSSAP